MIGLQVICSVYKIEYKDLARELSITPQTINSWLRKKRNIPETRIDQLSQYFQNIPREYFQKTLTKSEEINVQIIYLEHTDTIETIEIPVTDDDGNYMGWREESYSAHAGIIGHLDNGQQIEQIIERVRELGIEEISERITFNNFLDVLDRGNAIQMEFLKELLLYLNNKEDSQFMIKYEELGAYLRKYNVL